MKVPADRGGNVPRGVLQEATQKRKPPIKTKGAPFDTLVARYYPAVYSFASRLTDDPREAVLLAHDAFNNTRKQLRTYCDENVFASILMSSVIRAGLNAA
jgi:DNA-directed RNA polymerase specialized sigma24 family protein